MDIYYVPLPAGYFSASACCLYCCVCGHLSVFWQFVELSLLWSFLYCGVSSLWVGLDGWLVKISWLGKLVSVFLWVELDFFPRSALKCPVMSYEMSVGLE